MKAGAWGVLGGLGLGGPQQAEPGALSQESAARGPQPGVCSQESSVREGLPPGAVLGGPGVGVGMVGGRRRLRAWKSRLTPSHAAE